MKRFALFTAAVCAAGLILGVLYWQPSNQGPHRANAAAPAPPAPAPLLSASITPPATPAPDATGAPAPFAILKLSVLKPVPRPFEDFSAWASNYLSNTSQMTAARGEALAWKRREALAELIQTDPQRALELAVPFAWRRDLPQNITRHFEQQVDGRGSLMVAVATDFERSKSTVLREAHIGSNTYQAFVYGRRLSQPCKENIPLHGIAVDNKLAVDESPIRILEQAEAEARQQEVSPGAPGLCSVCGRPAVLAADVGGYTAHFCDAGHAGLVSKVWILAEGGNPILMSPGDQTGSAPWSLGSKSLLYMRVNFPDDLTEPISEPTAYAVMDEVNSFYVEGSYNQTAITPTVTPLLTLPQTKGWYSTAGAGALLTDAREAARLAGYDTANYNLDIVSLTSVPEYDWGGLGYVGGKGTWLQSSGAGVTDHELGHNYGVMHGNFWETTNYSSIALGTNIEYGNSFDTMGAASGGANHFNANFKSLLQWLPDAAIQTVTSTGLCRIFPFDAPQRVDGRVYAARVRRDFERDYWVEFRDRFPWNPWISHGVLLNWSAWAESSGGTDLIDTTPGSPDGKNDAAVVIGRTFSDYPAGVHITPVALAADGTNRWIDVQINAGFFPSNRPPKLKLLVSPTNAAPGEIVHFQAEASDRDGDELAYTWFGTSYDTDDLTVFSTNNLPWTYRTWSTSGTRVIRCVVSDMKGGIASANAVVNVGTPSGFTVSGQVTDPNGRPLEGILITTNPEGTDRIGYTDSHGNYVIAGIQGQVDLQAIKYGYSFTNSTWTNPVEPIADTRNIDFTAIALPAVKIEVGTNVIAETNTAPQYIFLTHTGDTNQDVSVKINLSGSATLSSDYTLSPALAEGENTVTIPAGTNVAVIQFQAINDTIAEFAESMSLTIVEDGSMVVGTPGEATITIIDNDTPARPRVSIVSLVPRVPEDGMDSATFVVTRLGSVAADLPVFYSTGGTATAGADYTNQLGVLVIPAGQAEATLKIPPINDKLIEVDETLSVTLKADAAYTIGTASAQAIIVSDDVVKLTVYPTAGDAAEPNTPGRFTFKREGDLSGNLEIGYAVGGTATPAVDYHALSGRLVIPAGATSADVYVIPIDDKELEGDESVIITVTNAPGCDSDTPATATLLIKDKEKTTVSITATDGNASEPGDDIGTFVISRGSVVNGALTVPLAISGLALNGVDYIPLDRQVVIPDGASSVTLDVIPFDDLHAEPIEDVQLVLLPSTNYNLGTDRATVWITDNDDSGGPSVGFTAASSRFVESQSPGISVYLSVTSSAPVTVNYRVIGGTASSDDYTLPDGTLTFEPGNRALSIPLVINDDTLAEPDETIRVVLSDPSGASFDGIKLHTYTIIDDDTAKVSVSATVATATETGPTAGNFRISRTGSTSSNLVVNFQVTGTAAAAADYVSLGSRAVIPAGASYVDLPVVPVNDPTEEFSETVKMTLVSAPTANIISPNTATITITDNDSDARPVVSISSTASPFAVEGGTNGLLTVTRTGPTTTNLTVYITTGGTATSGLDYTALATNIDIPAGQSTATVPVVAVDDTLIEGEETVVVALTTRDNYRVAYPSAATVVVQDNDQSVRVDPSDLVASEPGTDEGEFTFTRFGTTNTPLKVFFSTSGSAIDGVDYRSLSNFVVIPAGSLTATLPVVALDDVLIEGPETLTLKLQSDPAYTIGDAGTATITIEDDEPMVTISATVETVVEGSRDPAVITVTRLGDPKYEITARLVIGGSATWDVDYPAFTTNVVFTYGIMAVDLLIYPTNDLVTEGLETVTAALVPDPSYTIVSASNTVVSIIDAAETLAPTVTITSPTVDTVFLLGTNVNMILEATVSNADTNLPLNIFWSKVEGPNTLWFGTNTNANTTVSFTNSGIYVLRLTADNGQLTNYAEVTAVVGAVELLSSNSLHWTFDEGSGTNVLDASGAARNAIISEPFNWSSNGVLGGALELGGAGSQVRESPASGFLNGLEAFTLSLWAKSVQTNLDQGLFAANDTGTNATLELSRRVYASGGATTNVIEAVIPTDEGVVRYVSANNATTDGWQQLVLCWSNSLPPVLYINGLPAQPLARVSVLEGALINSPQFLVGRGSALLPQSWEGLVDDVRLFPRALSAREIGALASLPPANYGAVVEAGSNITVQVTTLAELAGSVSDDAQPDPPGLVTTTWLVVEGPGNATFASTNALTNSVGFDTVGEYVFRLVADDGQVKTYDDVAVTVIEPTRVDIFASDPEAAELGPDTGTFSLQRSGDETVDLPVFLTIGGIASNGVDFVAITNVYVFPAGSNSLEVVITPFLDDRTEGDEPLTLTIVSNASYWIGNPEATVTIHDSPYGAWTVRHFTLEELTDPSLSGAGADFDNDSLVNFAEYAANRDPRIAETNPPVVMTVETDPGDGMPYLTIQYPRRLEPTDTTYEVHVSNDLATWNTGTNYVQELQATDDGNGLTETVKARLTAPFSTSTNQFVTVKIWLRVTKPD